MLVFAPGTSTAPTTTFHSGMTMPSALALESAGDLYVVNNGSNSVTRIQAAFQQLIEGAFSKGVSSPMQVLVWE